MIADSTRIARAVPFCNTVEARLALDAARQQHMLALQRAIAAGIPNVELLEDLGAFHHASGHLLLLCGDPMQAGPMHLVPAGTE